MRWDTRTIDRLMRVLQWRRDIELPDMIEAKDYARDYMGFAGPVSQQELNLLCDMANAVYAMAGLGLRVGNRMGELRPMLTQPIQFAEFCNCATENTLCRDCWGVTAHLCSCHERFMRFCVCERGVK